MKDEILDTAIQEIGELVTDIIRRNSPSDPKRFLTEIKEGAERKLTQLREEIEWIASQGNEATIYKLQAEAVLNGALILAHEINYCIPEEYDIEIDLDAGKKV